MNGESVDAYAAMYVIKEALEKVASIDPAVLRKILAEIKVCGGKTGILAYDCVEFDETGQNKNASLVIVQTRANGDEMDRITVWRIMSWAGYTYVLTQSEK